MGVKRSEAITAKESEPDSPEKETPLKEVTIEEKIRTDTDWENYINEYNSTGRLYTESENTEAPNYEAFTFQTYLSIGFVVIGTTFLTYLFNIYALQHVAPSIAGSYVYVQPAISFLLVIISALLLGYDTYKADINLVKILSCLLVVSGVYLVSKKQ